MPVLSRRAVITGFSAIGAASSRGLCLSLPKSRFVRIDGAARQGLNAQQRLRAARLDGCRARPFLAKRESALIIVGIVFGKNSPKVLGVENDQMISALAPDRPDQAFNVSVLPGR